MVFIYHLKSHLDKCGIIFVFLFAQVQNSKLSERLREKNHRLERQDEKIRQLEEDKDACTE